MSAAKDRPTRNPGSPTDSRNQDLRAFALTIQWHPSRHRVGAVALLEDLRPGRPVAVYRHSPLFSAPGSGEQLDLDDDGPSRTKPEFEIVLGARDGLELRPGSPRLPTEINGLALTRNTFIPLAEIDKGVVILLARRIVLCLQRRSPSLRRERVMDGLVGWGDGMERVRADIRRVANLDVPVLVRGETGTGKELVARALVTASRRAGKPFVRTSMAGVPSGTAYAELFGHERGAFTGALSPRSGHFVAAHGGTLFFDELGNVPPDVQAMLLRALDEGEILPLGSSVSRKVDVRLITATDADLERRMATGQFSHQLFQRLAGYTIKLPALRERREDFGPLLRHFLEKELAGNVHLLDAPVGDEKPWFPASLAAKLALGRWPGNVRALQNAARRLVIVNQGERRARSDEFVDRLMEEDDRGLLVGIDRAPSATTDFPRPAPQRPRSSREFSNQEVYRLYLENNRSMTATAAAMGLPRATVADMIDRNPLIPKATDRSDDELEALLAEHGGDTAEVAERLGVSHQALKLRLARLRRNRSRLR